MANDARAAVSAAQPAAVVTLNDIEVALSLAEALLVHVKARPAAPLTYAGLLAQARALHPRDAVLGRAVPVGLGPKLQLVARFCAQHGYPNLAALAVHPATGQPGPHADGPLAPGVVAGTDWSHAPAQLVAAAQAWRLAVPARLKPRAERPADVAWYAWYRTHRAACAQVTAEGKLDIINLVMAGLDPDATLQRVLAAQADYGTPTAP